MSAHDDFTPLDATAWVRANAGRFFRYGEFNSVEAACRLVAEALAAGAQDVEVLRVGQWHVVSSTSDWLPSPADTDAFRGLVPFPEGGQNATRSEFLLTVFAKSVVVHTPGNATAITGEVDDDVVAALNARGRARSVAFLGPDHGS